MPAKLPRGFEEELIRADERRRANQQSVARRASRIRMSQLDVQGILVSSLNDFKHLTSTLARRNIAISLISIDVTFITIFARFIAIFAEHSR
jgi:hypothetical protein